MILIYHGPRNDYVNNSQRNKSCNCNCNLAAKIILQAIVYVIVIDAFWPRGTEAHANNISLENILNVITIVTRQENNWPNILLCMYCFAGQQYFDSANT